LGVDFKDKFKKVKTNSTSMSTFNPQHAPPQNLNHETNKRDVDDHPYYRNAPKRGQQFLEEIKQQPNVPVTVNHDEDYLVCKNCSTESSLNCIEPPLIKCFVMRFGYWLCPDCKICSLCNQNSVEQKMLFCDICDRGFDLDCLGLDDVPDNDWYCKDCSHCNVCSKELLTGVTAGNREGVDELMKTIEGYNLLCKDCFGRKDRKPAVTNDASKVVNKV